MPEPQRSAILEYFTVRFGIPLTSFADYALLERHKTFVLAPNSPHLAGLASLKIHSLGLPVLRKIPPYLKPTTAALQRFGQQASQHILELSAVQIAQLLQEHELPLDSDWQPGYILLRYAGHVLGCGLYLPGRLRSQLPRRQSVHPRFAIEGESG